MFSTRVQQYLLTMAKKLNSITSIESIMAYYGRLVGKKIEIAFWSSSASIKVQRFTIEIKMIKNFKILPYVSKDRHISSKKIWDFVMLQTDTTTFGDQFLKCCTVEFSMTKQLGGTTTKIFSKLIWCWSQIKTEPK